MKPKPSVGRAVHYYPPRKRLEDGTLDYKKIQPYPAEITHVWSETHINISVRNDSTYALESANQARVITRASVLEGAPDDAAKEGCEFWCWPPRIGSVAEAATPPPADQIETEATTAPSAST